MHALYKWKFFLTFFITQFFSNTKRKIGRQGQGLSHWKSKPRFDCCWMHLERSRSLLAASPFGSLDKFKGQFNSHHWNFGTKGRILTIRHFQMLAFSLFLNPNLCWESSLISFFFSETHYNHRKLKQVGDLKFYKKKNHL